MSFTLTIHDENNKETMPIIDPTCADIKRAVDILKQNPENFLILESSAPIHAFSFIQAVALDAHAFRAETQFAEGGALHMYYSDKQTEKSLTTMLFDFLSGISPDLNDWDYLDDFGQYQFYKEFELRRLLAENGFIALKSENIPENSIRLTTSDIQVFLKSAKESNVKTIFYSYARANKDAYDILKIRRDNDLSKVAIGEINAYVQKIDALDFGRPALLRLFYIDHGAVISMKIIAPWVDELTPADKFLESLEAKYVRELTEIKTGRNGERDNLLEELRTILLNDPEFIYCTNQSLRRDYIRRFLVKNEKYRQAFLNDDGYLNSYEMQSFVDMVYAVYKRAKK